MKQMLSRTRCLMKLYCCGSQVQDISFKAQAKYVTVDEIVACMYIYQQNKDLVEKRNVCFFYAS